MKNVKKNEYLFTLENTNIYYISNIITNLVDVCNKYYKDFMKCNILNEYIMKLNVISDKGYINNEKDDLSEIYERYKIFDNLLKIFKLICENEKDENLLFLITFKIMNIFYYIINDSIYINLNKCPVSKNIIVTISDVKNIFNEILNNINEIIINNEKILYIIIKSLINNDSNNSKNIYINKIKNIFIFIAFDSILINKYPLINKKIKSLIIELIYRSNNNTTLFNFLFDFYLSENTFDKIIKIYKEMENNNKLNNTQRFQKNSKNFFDISSQVLISLYGYIRNKINIIEYINKVLSPKIFNYTQFISKNFSIYSIIPQLIIGGACKIYSTILILTEFIANNDIDIKKKF